METLYYYYLKDASKPVNPLRTAYTPVPPEQCYRGLTGCHKKYYISIKQHLENDCKTFLSSNQGQNSVPLVKEPFFDLGMLPLLSVVTLLLDADVCCLLDFKWFRKMLSEHLSAN